MPGLARLEVVIPPSIEGAVDVPKLYIHAYAADAQKRRENNAKKSGPWPLNTSPQVSTKPVEEKLCVIS